MLSPYLFTYAIFLLQKGLHSSSPVSHGTSTEDKVILCFFFLWAPALAPPISPILYPPWEMERLEITQGRERNGTEREPGGGGDGGRWGAMAFAPLSNRERNDQIRFIGMFFSFSLQERSLRRAEKGREWKDGRSRG
jgi:hypothetical protein